MSAPFNIDPETGRVLFPDIPLELRPLMPEQEFIAASARLNRDNLGGRDGWQRYNIRQLIPGDRVIGTFLVFFNAQLKMLSLAYAHKDDSWDNWTEAKEREYERDYQQQLSQQLQNRESFPWGAARVQPDSKTGTNEIWIRYSDPAAT